MEFKGTKGEWVVQNKFRNPRIINESGQVIFEHKTDCYDTTDDSHVYYSHNKMIANAKLIAAAPDLLKVVELANKLSNRLQMPSEDELMELGYQSKKAIEKALK